MSRNYDNWERLVAAVLKKQQLWQLFHEQSRSPSVNSESSGFSFHRSSSVDEYSASYQYEDFDSKSASDNPSNVVVEDQSPVENVSFTRRKRRDLKIEVPNNNISPGVANLTPISGAHPKTKYWPVDSKQQSYPLPLPPVTNSNTSPFSRPNSAATSPSTPSRSPERTENVTSPDSHWKKGKFLGRGAFGNVYSGFNSETGDMCVMEVTLFSNNGESKRSVRQLGKQLGIEIRLLSSLRHPNIVQYYGSEMQTFYIHIMEQSNPSLLPVTPYWMEPEVIMNSNVRNRAIDIWSLGWTLLDMATSKPPLSHYEWMVAMFKAGNHRELPIIPDHLSDEGKDFVRRCLQWNPVHRATASQLLEHPFVKNLPPLQKPPPLQKQTIATNTVRSTVIDHARSFHQLDSGRLPIHSSVASIYNFHPSDMYTPRNISPVGSPLRHPRSPQHLNEMISPPPISSPHTTSSSSTRQIPIFSQGHSSPSYWDPNILRGEKSKSHAFQELPSREKGSRGKQLGSTANEQLVLADRVSKKLLNTPMKMNPSLDLNSSSRLPSHPLARV